MSILFNRRVSLQVDPITSTSARPIIISSQRCLFHPSPSCLCFSRPPTLFPQGLRFLYQVSFYFCEVSPFFSVNVLTRWFSRRCSTSSSFLVLFFSGGFNSSFGIKHTPFLFFQCFSYAGAPLNHPSLAIKLFRSAQDISKIRVSTMHSFKIFRGCSLIQAI